MYSTLTNVNNPVLSRVPLTMLYAIPSTLPVHALLAGWPGWKELSVPNVE